MGDEARDEEQLRAQAPQLDERARRALATAEQWVGGAVQGVAIGATDVGEQALVVYVTPPPDRPLPAECEGLPVVVRETDPFTAGG